MSSLITSSVLVPAAVAGASHCEEHAGLRQRSPGAARCPRRRYVGLPHGWSGGARLTAAGQRRRCSRDAGMNIPLAQVPAGWFNEQQ